MDPLTPPSRRSPVSYRDALAPHAPEDLSDRFESAGRNLPTREDVKKQTAHRVIKNWLVKQTKQTKKTRKTKRGGKKTKQKSRKSRKSRKSK